MPSTLPGPGFLEAVNANGMKQVIPEHWMAEGSPFRHQFRLLPSAVAAMREAGKEVPASPPRPPRTPRAGRTPTQAPPSGDDDKE